MSAQSNKSVWFFGKEHLYYNYVFRFIIMNMYEVAQWTDFFVAAAGAAAALAGLVIVAMSVNVQQIIKYRHLPSRAAATIGMLVLILVSCIAGLIHGQSVNALGIEVFIFGILGLVLQLRSNYQTLESDRQTKRPFYEARLEILTGQIQVWPFIIGAIYLMVGNTSGLYWLAVGTILVFILSIVNAWVLLIEILR